MPVPVKEKKVRRYIMVPVLYDLCKEKKKVYIRRFEGVCIREALKPKSILAGSRLKAGTWVGIRDTKRSAVVVIILNRNSTAVVVVGEKSGGV